MEKDFESIIDRNLEPDLKVLLGQFSKVVDNLVDKSVATVPPISEHVVPVISVI